VLQRNMAICRRQEKAVRTPRAQVRAPALNSQNRAEDASRATVEGLRAGRLSSTLWSSPASVGTLICEVVWRRWWRAIDFMPSTSPTRTIAL